MSQGLTNRNASNKTRKKTAPGTQETKSYGIYEKIELKKNRHGNFEPNLKTKITSTENSSRANSQEKRILEILEKFKHTKLSEIESR